jgi:hypothetical protein
VRLVRWEASVPEGKIQAACAIVDALDRIASSFCAQVKAK